MSRLKRLLHVASPSTCNTQQTSVQACGVVAQHAHTTQQELLHVALPPVARHQRLLMMLERDPEARYAVLTADDGSGSVLVAIAIRGAATVELEIERSRYDGILLLELIERHSHTIH